MVLPKETERRTEIRYRVAGQLPLTIFSRSGHQLAFHPIDVSASGFGVVLCEPIEQGSQLFLDVADYKKIPFLVVWIVPEASNDELPDDPVFRCGLGATNEDLNLIELLNKRSNLILTPKD